MAMRGLQWVDSLNSGSLFVFRAKLTTNAGITKLRIVWMRIMVVLFGTAWLHIAMAPFFSPHPFFRYLIRIVVVIMRIRIVDNKEQSRNRLLLNWI